jgi:4-aminobutyrate aminotransferase/(S)-3-amino-2-methylpropionate transaminase
VAFDHAYHGRTNLTMALTAKSMPYKSGFGPFAPEVYRAPLSYPYRDGNVDGVAAAQRAIAQIEAQVGAANVAALILEPVQGEGGFIVPSSGFWSGLSHWASAHGVVLIADEIQSGFGRTGTLFAVEHEGVVPDMVVTAKGIAGGMPLSAVTGRADIMDAPHPGGLGGTYAGNPIACAAALAAFEIYEQGELIQRAREIETVMTGRLQKLQADDGRIGDVRGRGAMIAIELVQDGTDTPDPVLTKQVAAYAIAHGVMILTCGTYGNVIRFLPPFTISDELLHDALDVVAAALAA